MKEVEFVQLLIEVTLFESNIKDISVRIKSITRLVSFSNQLNSVLRY